MQLIVNPNIHQKAGTTRERFLEQLSNVQAIRVNRDLWTINLYSTLKLKTSCPTKALFQMIHRGEFTHYRAQSSEFIFGVRVTNALFEFIKSTAYKDFLKQQLTWIAAQIIVDNRTTDFLSDGLRRHHAQEVERIVNTYNSPLGHDWDPEAYNQIFSQECGKLPYDFFRLGAQYDDDIRQKFNILESMTHFCFGIDEVYFTSIDWRNIVERGDNDPLFRSESDFEVWEEWRELFANRSESNVPKIPEVISDTREPGYVYLIHQQGSDLYKIGWSKSPNGTARRLRQLQVGNPNTLYIHASIPVSTEIIERELQRLFEHRNERGEWYRLTEDDLITILDPAWRQTKGIF